LPDQGLQWSVDNVGFREVVASCITIG